MRGARLAPVLEPAVRATEKWSAERIEVLREFWPAKIHSWEINAMLNALPGPAVSVNDASTKAYALLLRRPPGMRSRPAADDGSIIPDDLTEDDFEPILADFETVEAWASEHKAPFRSWADLPLVNVHRERRLLPTFARKFPVKGVRG